eukprot:TRINITY_DN530_c1_g1_i5.p1 TRINITY_DN530_c1_g1~~TRINITY_DN530_c1_g1_i5.p1  ORF type:complete len:129 (-),score=17.80 TRINITY_DN530_c1_g1_i5:237-623(-)
MMMPTREPPDRKNQKGAPGMSIWEQDMQGHTKGAGWNLRQVSHINRLVVGLLAVLFLLLLRFLVLALCVWSAPHPPHEHGDQHSEGNGTGHHEARDSTSTQPIIPCASAGVVVLPSACVKAQESRRCR